ncbi:MAG: PIN domain-containing protein [Phaeodactylibacter sp.]|nr:PIN domain-containing protein [Phaeodactylibacter sp.]MCB9304228.1 PIN domain-containing protein [Lewinellaceae bacterium]HQU57998.1 PIN domain-containing protein [Saprospiraceae bacterium]
MIYLLDTNIIIFFFKGRYDIAERMDNIGVENCFLSEISLAELKYGALYSQKPEKHNLEIENLLKVVGVIPITTA